MPRGAATCSEPRGLLRDVGDGGLGLGDGVEDVLRALVEDRALLGRLQAAGGAVEEAHPEVALELGDAGRGDGGGDALVAAGGGHRAELVDADEGPEVVDVAHRGGDPSIFRLRLKLLVRFAAFAAKRDFCHPRAIGTGGTGHVRIRHHLGLAGVRGALAARDHRHRLDRLVLLLRRARPRAEEGAAPAAGRLRRGVAGARRRLLPHPEVPGGAGADARAPGLVQVGELRDLALGVRDARASSIMPGRTCSWSTGRSGTCRPGWRSWCRWRRCRSAGCSTTTCASRGSRRTRRR